MSAEVIRKILGALALAAGVLSATPAQTADNPVTPRASPVAVGDVAPDFTLQDQDGNQHALSAERGRRIVVLVFYRGHW